MTTDEVSTVIIGIGKPNILKYYQQEIELAITKYLHEQIAVFSLGRMQEDLFRFMLGL